MEPLQHNHTFLVSHVPKTKGKGQEIRYGYLTSGDENDIFLFARGKSYEMFVRSAVINLEKKQFDALWNQTGEKQLSLREIELQENGLDYTIQLFDGKLGGLILARSQGKPESEVTFPLWLGPEVTLDERYSSSSLALLSEDDAKSELGWLLDPPQSAVGSIPFLTFEGETKVVLITNKGGNRWILPKGSLEEKLGPPKTAQLEALEEAGIEGDIVSKNPIPIPYWSDKRRYMIDFYTMNVATLHMKWKEDSSRQRKLCNKSEAISLLQDPYLSQLLEKTWPKS